ncbi:MAG: glycosyltransferase family 4 protein [Granulosicoccus sp.]|nr:glycosyltransferase family 4 protein [Granulosicoccus sp.]
MLTILDKSRVKGCLDGIEGHVLVGWFQSGGSESNSLMLLVDGQPHEPHQTINCDVARPDVIDEPDSANQCGFRVPLHGLEPNKVYRISVLHEKSGFDFHAEKLYYCPMVADQAPVLRKLFLPEYYRYSYRHEALSNGEAFEHYLRFGIYADLSPNPWIDCSFLRTQYADLLSQYEVAILGYLAAEAEHKVNPSRLFNTEFYAQCNPDLAGETCLLAHFVTYGHREGRQHRKLVLSDSVRREISYLGTVEPDLFKVGANVDRIERYPNLLAETYIPELIKRRFPNQPKVIVCVPFLSVGGADLISTFVLSALEERFGTENVLMLVTDRSEHSVSSWTNPSSNILFLDESQQVHGLSNRIDLLHSVIGSLSPDIVLNINSHAAWGVYVNYGKQLSRYMALNAMLFCFDYREDGLMGGYIREYLPRSIPYLNRVMCDNSTIIKDIKDMFGFADEKMQKFSTVYVPVPKSVKPLAATNFARIDAPILWIGRLARQKRPELLLEIAARMRGQKFVVYGPAGDSSVADRIMSNEIENIDYRGIYEQFDSLDLSKYSLLLNTSSWEGLPTLLIQVLATGLPVVTSSVGGISELIDDTTGWPVLNDYDPEAYLTQIRRVFLHRNEAVERSIRGLDRVGERHNWQAFTQQLDKAGIFSALGDQEPTRLLAMPRLLAG